MLCRPHDGRPQGLAPSGRREATDREVPLQHGELSRCGPILEGEGALEHTEPDTKPTTFAELRPRIRESDLCALAVGARAIDGGVGHELDPAVEGNALRKLPGEVEASVAHEERRREAHAGERSRHRAHACAEEAVGVEVELPVGVEPEDVARIAQVEETVLVASERWLGERDKEIWRGDRHGARAPRARRAARTFPVSNALGRIGGSRGGALRESRGRGTKNEERGRAHDAGLHASKTLSKNSFRRMPCGSYFFFSLRKARAASPYITRRSPESAYTPFTR